MSDLSKSVNWLFMVDSSSLEGKTWIPTVFCFFDVCPHSWIDARTVGEGHKTRVKSQSSSPSAVVLWGTQKCDDAGTSYFGNERRFQAPQQLPHPRQCGNQGAYCAESIRDLSLSECPVQKERGWVKQLRVGAPIG